MRRNNLFKEAHKPTVPTDIFSLKSPSDWLIMLTFCCAKFYQTLNSHVNSVLSAKTINDLAAITQMDSSLHCADTQMN